MMRSENFTTPGTQSTFKMVELKKSTKKNKQKKLKTKLNKLSIENTIKNRFIILYLMIAVLLVHGYDSDIVSRCTRYKKEQFKLLYIAQTDFRFSC